MEGSNKQEGVIQQGPTVGLSDHPLLCSWLDAMRDQNKPTRKLNSDFNGMPTFELSVEDPKNPATHGFAGLTMMGPTNRTECCCLKRGEKKCATTTRR